MVLGLFGISCGLTAIMLFALGAVKSTMTIRSWWLSGLEMLTVGGFVSAISYIIGFLIEEFLLKSNHAKE
ncbi:MAG: hypothetical protein SGPRY_006854 [Prymnesium sp.]